MKFRPVKDIYIDMEVGLLIRNRYNGEIYLVGNVDVDRAIGVKTIHITNPNEWEVEDLPMMDEEKQ